MNRQSIKNKWSTIICDWKKSGLSQKRYCDEKGISLNTFNYHKKKVAINERLVELPAIPIKGTDQISIHLQTQNIELKLPDNFNKQTLSALFELLGVVHVR